MNKIRNLEELRLEIKRLEESSHKQRDDIKKSIVSLKESLHLSNIISGFISDVTGIKTDKKNFLKEGFAYTASLLFQQFFLKSEKKFEKNVYGAVDSIIDKIRSFVHSFSDSEAKRREREANENQQ